MTLGGKQTIQTVSATGIRRGQGRREGIRAGFVKPSNPHRAPGTVHTSAGLVTPPGWELQGSTQGGKQTQSKFRQQVQG